MRSDRVVCRGARPRLTRPPRASSGGRAAALAALLLVSLALRVWAIEWGLPRVDLNPDELNVLQVTRSISWGSLDPGFYSYSGLTFYLDFVAAEAARTVGLDIGEQLQLLINRLWSVLFGTLTVLVVYLCGRTIWDQPRPALLAAGWLALIPLHVTYSHFGLVDIGLTFWCSVAFLAALVAYRRPSFWVFLVGGLAVGVAVGTKFNGFLVGSSFIAAAALLTRERRLPAARAVGWLGAAATATLVGFFASSPYSLLRASETVGALEFELHHVHQGHPGFDLSALGWQYHRGLYQLVATFPFSLGIALYALVVVGLVVFIARARRSDRLLVLTFPAVYLGIVASWTFVPLRYYLPVVPMLLLGAAWTMDRMLERRPRLTWILIAAVAAYTLTLTATYVNRFRSDTRLEAAAWAAENLPPHAHVWYGEPILASYVPRFPARPDIQVDWLTLRELRSARARMLESPGHGYLILSSLSYMRHYRQGNVARADLVDAVRHQPNQYDLVVAFDDWYLNKRLYGWLDPMFGGYFVSPRIEIYRAISPQEQRSRRILPSWRVVATQGPAATLTGSTSVSRRSYIETPPECRASEHRFHGGRPPPIPTEHPRPPLHRAGTPADCRMP